MSSFMFVGCKDNVSVNKIEKKASIEYISSKDLSKKDGFQIIDTRNEDMYIGWKNNKGISGHIKKAIDFPTNWIELSRKENRLDKELERRGIDKEKETILYGDDDLNKSIVDKFSSCGFKNIKILKGGINEYSKENKELERLQGYDFYVSPKWVDELLSGKKPEGYDGRKYKIVEIGLPKDDEGYDSGHIKGAIFLDPNKINQIPGPRELTEYENIPISKQREFWGFPKDKDIKKVLESAGIDKDTLVILYGSTKATTAANRAALVMDYAGVKNIKIINGGKTLWKIENRKLYQGNVETEKVNFGCEIPQNKKIVFDREQELKFINDKKAVIASVRSWDEYLGKISGYTYIDKAGDIKNSRFAYAGSNPYAMEDFRNIDNTMFNYNIIKNRWEKWGIKPDKTVSFHCGTGWRAAETYYISKALGYKNSGVYVGGWYQWTKYPNSPVKEKGIPKDSPEKEPKEFFE